MSVCCVSLCCIFAADCLAEFAEIVVEILLMQLF